MLDKLEVEHESDRVAYIDGYCWTGRRPFTDDEADLLSELVLVADRAVETAPRWIFAGIACMLIGGTGFFLTDHWLFGWTLAGGVLLTLTGFISLRSNRDRSKVIRSELEFGQIDTYGHSPLWENVQLTDRDLCVFRHSPQTGRLLWVQKRYLNNVYRIPTFIAIPPGSHENLVGSGWLSTTSPLHRDLSSSEVAELKKQCANRWYQVVTGVLALVGIVTIALSTFGRFQFTGLEAIPVVFLGHIVRNGWSAHREYMVLRRDLGVFKVELIEHRQVDGSSIHVEYLHVSGILWTVQSAPAPWRGLLRAR